MKMTGDGQGGVALESGVEAGIEAAVDRAPAAPGFAELICYLVVFMLLSWCVMYFTPTGLLFTVLLPASFYALFGTVLFCPLVSGGWPWAPPLGNWKPADGIWKPGIGTTLLIVGLCVLGPMGTSHLYPRIPLFPVGFWWGIILFGITLWYAFVWNGWPVNRLNSPALRCIGGAAVILVVSGLVWRLLNLSSTPFAGAPYDPKGPLQCEWFFGFMVWSIVWIQAFSNVLTFQQWPFYKVKQPFGEILSTAVCFSLGWLCWTVSLKFMSPTLSFAGIAGSIIGMQNFHGAIFGYYPFAKYRQPVRGMANFATEIVLAFAWTALNRVLMAPIVAKVQAAGLPFDVNVVTVLYTLHLIALFTLMHNFFFLRAPFPPSGPPPAPE